MKKWIWPVLLLCGAVRAETLEQNLALCAGCHGAHGEGNQTLGAPGLAAQGGAYLEHQLQSFKSGKRGYHPDDQPGLRMRAIALKLSDAEITALSAQFAAMKSNRTASTVKAGSAQYGSTCMACHGQYAQGYAQLLSPNLNIVGGWYIAAQIDAYNRGWRGTAEGQDPPSLMMRTIASHISSRKELDEVIAYIGSLNAPVRP